MMKLGCAFEDFDVVRGARYHYRLRARNASGVSSFSACDAGYAGSQPVRVAVAADYDGDGVSDLALFHPETGEWFVQSINGELLAYGAYWGGAGFLTLQGDFDGDGACDFAAYDADSGAWYVSSLEGRIIVFGEVWGGPGWIPVAGDYDGDGAADLAVYEPRPACGTSNVAEGSLSGS